MSIHDHRIHATVSAKTRPPSTSQDGRSSSPCLSPRITRSLTLGAMVRQGTRSPTFYPAADALAVDQGFRRWFLKTIAP